MGPFRTAQRRRLKLGVVANEFFEPALGRMGGFGWATQQVARCFNGDPSLVVEVVFLTSKPGMPSAHHETSVDGTRLLFIKRSSPGSFCKLWSERFDLLLTIDYRPNYLVLLWALPLTPVIVWVRTPRPPEEICRVLTTCIPGAEQVAPQGIESIDCTSLRWVVRSSRWLQRPVVFAYTDPYLAPKIRGTYGVEAPEASLLPNIIPLPKGKILKSSRPTVVFLGRLDPIKRPWLVLELAKCYPDVDFLLLGKPHFKGEGAWIPESPPGNVQFLGHVSEDEKIRLLSKAWVLVNTSIHEGLAVSMLEALACETPLLSLQDPGG